VTGAGRPADTGTRRLHAVVSGRVQGVGFRASAQQVAQRLGLAGWVRNLADGRVELHAEGPATALDQLLDWLRQGPSLSRVDGVDVDWPSPDAADQPPLARPFQVRRDGW
jgi:acylphosphatase